jgi:head-tail adaptor
MSRDLDLPAGFLTKQVTIQSLPVNAPRDDWNQTDLVNGWLNVATIWAAIEPSDGRKPFYGELIQPDVTHLITIRFWAGFSPKWRLFYHDLRTPLVDGQPGPPRLFNVLSVVDVRERHIKMLLMCREVVT